jgi:membrane protein implicated in regulation of membrane protease activity
VLENIWIWGILGLGLLAVEMGTGTFYILWFGISALCISVGLWVMPTLPLVVQLFLFAALSLGSLAIWKMYYKQTDTHLRIGQSQGDEIGRVGTIIEPVSLKQNGRIQFAQGVMGSREWSAIANEDIETGAEAIITSIEGNALRVKRHA